MRDSTFFILFLSGLQKRLTALPPTLRSMKTDYASLRSQVRNFSDFYGAAISDAKKQVRTVTSLRAQAPCIKSSDKSSGGRIIQIIYSSKSSNTTV